MPRKRSAEEEEALRQKALELRRMGLSYRQIARELGCSAFKVHELLKAYESPQSRLKQAVELADRLEGLRREVEGLKESLAQARPLQELTEKLSKLEEKLTNNLLDLVRWSAGLQAGVGFRLDKESPFRCRWADDEGYCYIMMFDEEPWFGESKHVELEELKGYILNVRDATLACASCPAYTPADPALAEEVKRYVEARLGGGRSRAPSFSGAA
jgi:predicted transcriptional regulator